MSSRYEGGGILRTLFCLFSIVVLLGVAVPVPATGSGQQAAVSSAGDGWKREFEAVCSRTDDAMEMTPEELKSLVERCDNITPQIEALEPSARKVYLKRLRLCRELFFYVLGTKEKGKTGP